MSADTEAGGVRPVQLSDNEKGGFKDSAPPERRTPPLLQKVEKVLLMGRIEAKGIQPVPIEERTNTRYWNIFTIWCSMNTNILG